MKVVDLIRVLKKKGVELEVSGTKVKYRAPKGVLTPETRARLVQKIKQR